MRLTRERRFLNVLLLILLIANKIDSCQASQVDTMKTRHLYEADEVIAALHWCIRQGRTKEALFWCLELLDSEMEDTVTDELYKIWLSYFGVGCLSALPLLTPDSRNDVLGIVSGLSRLPKERRDRSVLGILLYGLQEKQVDRASHNPKLEPLFQTLNCSEVERAFVAAVFQGKTVLAFQLSRNLWIEDPRRVFELLEKTNHFKHNSSELEEALTLLEFHMEKENWMTRACAIATVSLHPNFVKESLKPLVLTFSGDSQESLNEWAQLYGRRRRRIYQIPHECLYKITKRGLLSNKVSTIEELYTLSDATLAGCPFWTRVIEEEVPWLDDDRKMDFYDLYFPDDIPDEWSRADQEKSHGWGCLINNEVPSYQKYWRRWYKDMRSRALWFLNRDFDRYTIENEKTWTQLYEKSWSVSTWCLTPVKKRILVVDDSA